MNDVALRLARVDDADAIADLHAASWRATYRGSLRDDYLDGEVGAERRALWRERLTAPAANQHVVVAVAGETIVGFACAYGADDARYGTQLDNLHVAGGRQGEGVGRALLAAVAAWCGERHPALGLYLWVVERNAGARRFYARLEAADAGGDLWRTPDGGAVSVRRCIWTPAQVAALAAGDRR